MPHATMPSNERPIIAVCGATGFQGGSVVKHLLQDGRFDVRALTRKPGSGPAKELARNGVTVVQADFDDIQSLHRAFEGCYGVYGVTDYFEALDNETQQGINIIDAAKATGIKHLVFSSGHESLDEIYFYKHKLAAAAYLKKSGVPYTTMSLSFYYANVFLYDSFQRNASSGGWIFNFPLPTDIAFPCMAPTDAGAFALGAFANPSEWLGKDMPVCSEYLTPRQYAEIYQEVTGTPVDIIEVTRKQFFAREHEPIFLQSWIGFKWFIDMHDGFCPKPSMKIANQLCPNRQTWRDYVTEHLSIPPKHPMMIQCLKTQERFST